MGSTGKPRLFTWRNFRMQMKQQKQYQKTLNKAMGGKKAYQQAMIEEMRKKGWKV